MKKFLLISLLPFLLASCNEVKKKNKEIQIFIENKDLLYSLNSDSLKIYNENKVFPNTNSKTLSTNLLQLSVKNNTKKKYLFLINDFELEGDNCFELNLYENSIKKGVTTSYINRADMGIIENTKIFACMEYKMDKFLSRDKLLRKAKFKNTQDLKVLNFFNQRFIIHPDEKIRFLYSLKIPFLEENNVQGLFDPKYFDFKPDKTYEFSVTYNIYKGMEKNLPKEIRDNLQENNIEIFYGSIESNRVPIKNVFKK